MMTEEDNAKSNRRRTIIIAIGVIVGLCIICAVIYGLFFPSDETPEPTSVAGVTAEATKEQATPAEETALPTEPPPPTNTLEPTNTPLPTATQTEPPTPTPVPDPIILQGSGDSVVDFENPFEVSIAHITGNAVSTNFVVWNYGEDGQQLDLLVNTLDPYDGVVLLDAEEGIHTTRFEITAVGEWTIIVDSLLAARKLEVPGEIEGIGDDVIILTGGTPDLANIKGNEAATNFVVWGYGTFSDLLVNTIDPYEGTVILAGDSVVLTFTAEGPWYCEVTER